MKYEGLTLISQNDEDGRKQVLAVLILAGNQNAR